MNLHDAPCGIGMRENQISTVSRLHIMNNGCVSVALRLLKHYVQHKDRSVGHNKCRWKTRKQHYWSSTDHASHAKNGHNCTGSRDITLVNVCRLISRECKQEEIRLDGGSNQKPGSLARPGLFGILLALREFRLHETCF